MKNKFKQSKYLHESRRTKKDSLGLEHKDKMANYIRERKKQQEKHLEEQKEKGFVTDNTWKLITGFKY